MNQTKIKSELIPSNRIDAIEEYYFSQKLPMLDTLNKSGLPTLNFGIGNPDLGPAPQIIKSLNLAVNDDFSHGYQRYNGSPDLRKAFCKWYRQKFNLKLDFEGEVLPLLGSKEGILYTSLAYLNFGDKVLIPDLGYPTYESATILAGGIPVHYRLDPENNWQPDWEHMENLDLNGVRIMWLNYPNMPTGSPADNETLEKAIEFGKKNKILICNDNPYSFILNDKYKSILSFPGAFETAIELNSLSKSHNMAGWRIGVVVGSEQIIRNILKVKSNNDSGMFLPIQKAAIAALEIENTWYEQLNRVYQKRQKLIEQLLNILGCKYKKDQQGLFVWAKVPSDHINGEEYSNWLLKEMGIFFTPGIVFGTPGELYIRASLCQDEVLIHKAIIRATKYDK